MKDRDAARVLPEDDALLGGCPLERRFCGPSLHRYMQHRTRFLMWSSIGLAGLTLNNAALIINVALPDFDLRLARLIPSLIGMVCLLYGLRWSTE